MSGSWGTLPVCATLCPPFSEMPKKAQRQGESQMQPTLDDVALLELFGHALRPGVIERGSRHNGNRPGILIGVLESF